MGLEVKNINTFMDYSRNGITVYSKSVTEINNYRVIARITDYGKITLYVPEDHISSDDKEKINQAAGAYRAELLQALNELPIVRRYEKLLDVLGHHVGKYLEFIGSHVAETLEQKVSCLEKLIYYME